MSFTTVPTVSNGDSWSAAQHNTYLRDNMAALWPYTTAGDMAYASGSNALARVGIGAAGTFWKSNGSVPAWGGMDFASVYHGTTQSASNGSATTLAFNSEISDVPGWHSTVSNTSRITVDANGNYMVSAWIIYTTGGGSGNYSDYVNINRNGSSVGSFRALQEKDANGKHFMVTIPIIGANAGQYFEVTLEQNSGEVATVASGARFSVLRIS